MRKSNVKVSIRELKDNGRLGVSVKAYSSAAVGSRGVIRGVCTSVAGKQLIATVPYEIVDVKTKHSLPEMKQMPDTKIVWVNHNVENHQPAWKTMIDHSCYDGFSIEELERRVSFEIEPMDSEGVIIIRANECYPEFQKGIFICRSQKQKCTFRQLVEKELVHLSLFDAMNSYFPPPTEGDEDYDAGECAYNIDNLRFRCNNNYFLDICYRAIRYMKEEYKK